MNLSLRRESYAKCGFNWRYLIRSWLLLLVLAAGQLKLVEAQPRVAGAVAPASAPVVASFGQLYHLTKEQAAAGLSFNVEAVVLCYDPGWGQLYFQDATETKWFSPSSFQRSFAPGDLVQLRASTQLVEGVVGLTNLQAEVVGHRELPPAKPLRPGDFARNYGDWVETSGQVRVADMSWGRLALVLEDAGRSCLVYVMGPVPGKEKQFIGCTVKVRGINASKVENGQLLRASLFAPGSNEVKVVKSSSFDSASIPVSAIEKLLTMELGPWTNAMVHVNGFVSSYKPGTSLDLRDPTGLITAEVVQMTRVLPDQRIDLWGFPVLTPEGLVLKDSYFEPAARDGGESMAAEGSQTISKSAPALTNASEIVRLSQDQSAAGIAVCLNGVVTYADPEWHNLFLRDPTGEVYVDSDQPNIRAGQLVQLRGRTSAGGFAPEVKASSIEVLGSTNLPAPAQVDLSDLADGHLDGHYVELQGVVRRVTHEWNHLDLVVTTAKGRFRAIVPSILDPQPASKLLDCLVSVQGACGSQLNLRGQLSGITLHVPSLAQIRIIDPAPADPFAVRASSIASIGRFDPEQRAGHRIKVKGSVLLVVPRSGFYLQDATGGVRVETQDAASLQPGDLVEVLGFPALGEAAPYLDEATFRRLGSGRLPPAKRVTAQQILIAGSAEAQLVEIEAQLVQQVPRSARPKLLLQDGNILFIANLGRPGLDQQFVRWKVGSLLRLRGVCSIQSDDAREPQGFKLLLSGTRDIVLLKSPPWWGIRQILILLGVLSVAIGAAFAWIALLRRQVRAQTAVLHENQRELLQVSRQAGMAEVATSVLHNVGNVLNSINVSVTLLDERIRKSRAPDLNRLVTLLGEKSNDLGAFFATDPRGAKIPEFLTRLSQRLAEEQGLHLAELAALQKNVAHVKDIISMQQNYARISGVIETVQLPELLEDTLRMNAGSLERHEIRVVREYAPVPSISTDKHKVLQILINLVRNANYACEEANRRDKQLTLRLSQADEFVTISVIDNGVGIPAENLTRIFNHGFTTRKNGHGFGLHSGALAAKELGGALSVHSEGAGKGATFTLALPKNSRPTAAPGAGPAIPTTG